MLDQRIKMLRLSRNMSQVDLASRLGVSKQSICNWENDNIQPSIEMLVRLAELFSVSTDYMLGLDDREYVDVSGLPADFITHIRQLIEDFEAITK